jgi:hypothetical protein
MMVLCRELRSGNGFAVHISLLEGGEIDEQEDNGLDLVSANPAIAVLPAAEEAG